MDKDTILYLITISGCVIGIMGFISGRDKRRHEESLWRGSVDTKLDYIHNSTSTLPALEKQITETEASTKSAHIRIGETNERVSKMEDQFRELAKE